MKQYFAYIRVSTLKQGEHGSSLQEQKTAIEDYANRQTLSIVEWFEERETAAKQGRAVFSRMLSKLTKGEAEGLIIHKIDRSARNLKDWAELGGLIDRGVDVHFAHDSVDLRSRGGRLSADIQAVVAADYVRNLREEVIKGLRGRLNQGLYPFAAPVGYLNRGKAKLKEIDPIQGPLVQQAFELYATGTIGLKDLRTEMKRRGLHGPRTHQTLGLNSIAKMLRNPFYIGVIRIKRSGATYQGKHEPLIRKALFDRVQDVLDGKLYARTFKHDHLFRRMVRCAGCGYHLIGELIKSRYTYYRCHSESCRGIIVREEDLDHEVRAKLQRLQLEDDEWRWIQEAATAMRETTAITIDQMHASFSMRAAQCDQRIARLTDAYLDRMIDKEVFEKRKVQLFMERRELLDQIETLSVDDLPVNRALEKLELGNSAYFSYKNGITAEKRDVVASVTSNFVVQGKKPVITLQSPYQEIANRTKSHLGAPRRCTARTSAMQILGFSLTVAIAEKKQADAKKAAQQAAPLQKAA